MANPNTQTCMKRGQKLVFLTILFCTTFFYTARAHDLQEEEGVPRKTPHELRLQAGLFGSTYALVAKRSAKEQALTSSQAKAVDTISTAMPLSIAAVYGYRLHPRFSVGGGLELPRTRRTTIEDKAASGEDYRVSWKFQYLNFLAEAKYFRKVKFFHKKVEGAYVRGGFQLEVKLASSYQAEKGKSVLQPAYQNDIASLAGALVHFTGFFAFGYTFPFGLSLEVNTLLPFTRFTKKAVLDEGADNKKCLKGAGFLASTFQTISVGYDFAPLIFKGLKQSGDIA